MYTYICTHFLFCLGSLYSRHSCWKLVMSDSVPHFHELSMRFSVCEEAKIRALGGTLDAREKMPYNVLKRQQKRLGSPLQCFPDVLSWGVIISQNCSCGVG